MTNKFNFPNLGYGMGLRTTHYQHILSKKPKSIDWFEIISENFMDTDGRPIRILEQIKESYPVVMHGVAMSIGTVDPMNTEYFTKLKKLADWLNPPWISDHLCWTGVAHKNTHDLLPVPYTEEALKHIVSKIKQVQDFLERPILLENPSTYLEFKDSSMPEWEFIARMAEESDCGLLLDVNNVYVSSYNHRLDPKEYIDAIPEDRVVQIHLSGHENHGTHIIDTHEGHVVDDVWELYKYTISRLGEVTTMVEWDDNIPEYEVVEAEVNKAREFAKTKAAPNQLPNFYQDNKEAASSHPATYKEELETLQSAILSGDIEKSKPREWIRDKADFPPEKQLFVYVDGYRYRLFEVSSENYLSLQNYLGDDFEKLMYDYIESHPSTYFNIDRYIENFPQYVKETLNDTCAYEICLLETEIAQIFHMKETEPLEQKKFRGKNPEQFLSETILPRTALKLFKFNYPVNSYYRDVMDEKKPKKPQEKTSYLAIYRHEDKVWRLELEEEEYSLLTTLFDGNTIGEALEDILANDSADPTKITQNLQKWFGKWISNGLLAEAA